MLRSRRALLLSPLLLSGCFSGPLTDNPLVIRPESAENPILIYPGQASPSAYAETFEKVQSVIAYYFPIAYSNRYDGRIVSADRIAPGYEQPWKPGSPNSYERLEATLQTLRHRCIVQIRAEAQGGYLVQVTVLKELKDDPRPLTSTNVAVFNDNSSVERNLETVDAGEKKAEVWIPRGRDVFLEQAILRKIRQGQMGE